MLACSKVALFGKVDREMTAWEELRLVAGRADYSVTTGDGQQRKPKPGAGAKATTANRRIVIQPNTHTTHLTMQPSQIRAVRLV